MQLTPFFKRAALVMLTQLTAFGAFAQDIQNNPGSNHANKFEQLGTILPTPNEQRTASGAPGRAYWQQQADYNIKCTLDEKNLLLNGSETITYTNNSPDPLSYLWLQLDENEHNNLRNANYQSSSVMPRTLNYSRVQGLADAENKTDNGYGVNIKSITDAAGKPLPYTINKTMMRIDLPAPLKHGEKKIFNITWSYKISDRMAFGGRGGYEYFPQDGNYLFTMTQWYPRLCVYSDFQGWQNHQFTGRGEFALTFGDFDVQMTVPADHIVGATGECVNYANVLNATQLKRYNASKTSRSPVEVVTLAEAKAAEKTKSTATKTWRFNAKNVRDFAWTASRKFIWDAMGEPLDTKTVMCMSFYPKEAYTLYRRLSTRAVAHTVKTYSHFTFDYPYPVAQSVEASNGMEYPMICFNYGRTEPDGTYSEGTKNGMLGVVIHEVGHNFFPMIVNSDERQWTWMDEGLNSFLEYLTEELWDNKFPTKKGPAYTIVPYMKLSKNDLEPIMTNSENIEKFGPNAYSKPATGLNILRETIMGRELFDFAFKQYARRWMFKHPTPADFFRTMEDASGEDLDWFWRGWFYGTNPVDISLDSVKYARANTNALPSKGRMTKLVLAKPDVNEFEDISKLRNRLDKNIKFYTDADTAARDFYWSYARNKVPYKSEEFTIADAPAQPLNAQEKENLNGKYFYELNFSNKGGMVMPVIVEFTYADGTKDIDRIPAQIWRHDEQHASKLYVKNKQVTGIRLDPMRETADIDESNNVYGGGFTPTSFDVFKARGSVRGASNGVKNPMQALKGGM